MTHTSARERSLRARIASRIEGLRTALTQRREALKTREGRERALLASIGPMVTLLVTVIVAGPVLTRLDRYGMHDWDAHTAYRYITKLSLVRYGEAGLWNPYFCGGYTSWGYVEGSTNLVSPFLFLYLLAPLRTALRLEVITSALLLCGGVYLLAGRFTRSPALRSLAVVLGALNGRWALQAAAGHTWHLQYAWLPIALYFYDVAIVDKKRWAAVWCGVVLALMLYMGAIYPLPHAVLVLVAYGALHVVLRRTLRPIGALAIAGACALGLAAPKLLPLAETMAGTPRLIASTEELSLGQLVTIFTSKHVRFEITPIPLPEWPWHEFGIYIGWSGVGLLLVAIVVGQGTRTLALKLTALALLLLGAGSFHEKAPWALLHKMPLFASQHVPSRFLYPGVMLLAVTLGAALDPWARRLRERFGVWAELALMVPVVWLAIDIGDVGNSLMARAFVKVAPIITFGPVFEHHEESTLHYVDTEFPEQGPPVLLPMMANQGVVRCYGIGDIKYHGAIAKESPRYPGDAYVSGGRGAARVVAWSPSKAVVEYADLEPGAAVVYNMNFDKGWLANGARAEAVNEAVGTNPPAGSGRVVFRYFPRSLGIGLVVFGVTVGAIGAAAWVRRRRVRARLLETRAPSELL